MWFSRYDFCMSHFSLEKSISKEYTNHHMHSYNRILFLFFFFQDLWSDMDGKKIYLLFVLLPVFFFILLLSHRIWTQRQQFINKTINLAKLDTLSKRRMFCVALNIVESLKVKYFSHKCIAHFSKHLTSDNAIQCTIKIDTDFFSRSSSLLCYLCQCV